MLHSNFMHIAAEKKCVRLLFRGYHIKEKTKENDLIGSKGA